MTLEEEMGLVFNALGRSISAWGAVEITLSMLFSTMASGDRKHPSLLATFFAIENTRSKIQVIDTLFQDPFIDKEIKTKWITTHEHIRKRQKKRNRIAHHDIFANEDKPERKRVLIVRPFMSPLNQLKFLSGDDVGMSIDELEKTIEEFIALKLEVLALVDFILEWQLTQRLLHSKPAAPQDDPK